MRSSRILITLAPDAPNWATAGGRGGNYKVDSNDFADFAAAVGRRYSGTFGGLPAAYLLSLVVLKHITCEQALRDGTSLDKSVAVDLQQWIVHSVRAQHSLLPVYLRHLLTLFRFLQNKACLSARSPRMRSR